MIITKRFVFIHMHKTGGQTLNDIIRRSIADSRVIGYHYPRAEIPHDSTNLPVIGMVRNPWDWYVSWYAFNKKPKINNALFNVVSDSGQANFKSTITNLIHLGSDQPSSQMYRDDLMRMLPAALDGNRGVGLVKDDILNLSNHESGYCSWLFHRMLGPSNDEQTYIGKFEHLRDDFLSIMQRLSVEEIDAITTELDKSERRNASRHTHYSHYYDDELKGLVASKESSIIDKFAYEFDCIKPLGVAYAFPTEVYTGTKPIFSKLLGREKNYLKLHDELNVHQLREKIESIPAAKWLESERERLFDVHRDTQALLLIHFEDHKYKKPDHRDLWFELQNELRPVVDYIAKYYQDNGFIVRLLLAKLLVDGKIPSHTDAGYSLLNCHRIHIPLVTNDQVIFTVGGEEKNMQTGELWEINNGQVHAVENRGNEDRIHLIVDWMPNYDGIAQENVLAPERTDGATGGAVDDTTLNAVIAQGHQLHQSGQIARAESQYRQVLHIDDGHVIANNLLGLLCLQTKRFDEAVNYITMALAKMPDDAQAHSNLGLALNGLNRPEDAARHFHESLKLVPNNPRVYNNLGNIYVTLRRINDAIKCYEQALRIQPNSAEVHLNLGSAWLYLRKYPEAVASLQQCLTLNPDLPEGKLKLEQALRGLDGQDSALN